MPAAPAMMILPREYIDQHKRERCALALSEIVHEVGYHQLTASRVCARARIARNTFYKLFDGCDGAFRWTCDYALAQVLGPIEEAFETPAEWDVRVEATIEALVAAVAKNPLLAELYLVHSQPPESFPGGAELASAIASLLEEAPAPPEPRPEQLELLLAQAIVSVLAQRLAGGTPDSIPGLAGDLTTLVLSPYNSRS